MSTLRPGPGLVTQTFLPNGLILPSFRLWEKTKIDNSTTASQNMRLLEKNVVTGKIGLAVQSGFLSQPIQQLFVIQQLVQHCARRGSPKFAQLTCRIGPPIEGTTCPS
ncbi:unnamed protein product [Polarella glacialis]|uniref:Uncharacterized protein n=1 Tax=Polarella glacialis TaxID=89957 RepID=A0A813JF36_POLGL|nr:unnamed protein product [Polarella glacialis]